MKRLLLFLALTVYGFASKAQINFEHTYVKGGTWNVCQGNVGQVMVVDFEVSGEQFVHINRCDGKIEINNLSHSLVKSIPLSTIPKTSQGVYGAFLYFSEKLFDNDPGIEFMYVLSDTANFTYIFNEDGTQLFMEKASPLVIVNVHLQQYPIYNTAAGTKMILTYNNGDAKVFGLPGKLSLNIAQQTGGQLADMSTLSMPYPNPANTSFTIDYSLPVGTSSATIMFTDIQGREMKRIRTSNTEGSVKVSTSEFAPGTYYYYLVTESGRSMGNKVLIIK
jgi:hypothetical protein